MSLLRADARALPLVDGCVDCCVTSPPYFGLRDYGSAGQIGLEPTPDEYVAQLVQVFREVRRVLKEDGTLWLNLGDSYTSMLRSGREESPGVGATQAMRPVRTAVKWGSGGGTNFHWSIPAFGAELKQKDLMGIPWRVAFALQADGWYLRSDIIWHKPNPMPESVTDRPTKAHEYLFLLTKSQRYYYDAKAISEISATEWTIDSAKRRQRVLATGGAISGGTGELVSAGTSRNRRSVWTVPTMPFSGAHFATMPEKLVEPCILAGSRMGGLVLDPFIGSGTVGVVAARLGRRWVGTDLAYHDISKARTRQRGLLSLVGGVA